MKNGTVTADPAATAAPPNRSSLRLTIIRLIQRRLESACNSTRGRLPLERQCPRCQPDWAIPRFSERVDEMTFGALQAPECTKLDSRLPSESERRSQANRGWLLRPVLVHIAKAPADGLLRRTVP